MNVITSNPPGRGKTLRYVTFGIMCILTLFCIAADIKFDILRDSYVFTLCIFYAVGLIFLTALFGFMVIRDTDDSEAKRYILLFICNIFLSLFFYSLGSSLYLLPGHARLITLLATASYFFSIAMFLTLWLYQKQFLEDSVLTRIVTVLIVIALIVYTVFLIVNMFRPIFFSVTEEGYFSDEVTDHFGIFIDLFFLMLLSVATFLSRLSINRKLSFLTCIFVPVLFTSISLNQDVSDWNMGLISIVIVPIIMPLSLIFFNAHDELEKDILRAEKEQILLQVSAMISQMQPHFLYNSLASIAALCEEDPKLAAEATNAFSKYLRENMDFADKNDPIPFPEELNHIRTYVWLEELRFSNRLKVEYDINCTSFNVPALSVQPMVENAIKHGICKLKSGGTVRISSFEEDRFYCVTVIDDGIGFDVRDTADDDRRHLGIENTRYRIQEMTGGSLDIVSTPGEGTTVTVRIPK
ncbi:MAG: histidine kinase [Lachnospiraceae bacterium]|nr:histidine kinase [Lachnospiraceae bacterium]